MAFDPIDDANNVPSILDGMNRAIAANHRAWLVKFGNSHKNALFALALGHNVATPVYKPLITIDLSMGSVQKIVVTDGNNFTIRAPINITQLAKWELIIDNESGGAMGSIIFNSAIHQSGFVAPANGKRTGVHFYIEPGSVPEHYQIGQWGPAV